MALLTRQGSDVEGERVIISDDGGDSFVEEVASVVAGVVSGDLNIDSRSSDQIAVDGVTEIVTILTFVDDTNQSIADLVSGATENRPGVATQLMTAVSANQPAGIVRQSVDAIADTLQSSPLGQQQQAEVLAQISDVTGIDVGQVETDAQSGVNGTVGATPTSVSRPAPLSNSGGSPPSGGGGGGGGDTVIDQPPASAS